MQGVREGGEGRGGGFTVKYASFTVSIGLSFSGCIDIFLGVYRDIIFPAAEGQLTLSQSQKTN